MSSKFLSICKMVETNVREHKNGLIYHKNIEIHTALSTALISRGAVKVDPTNEISEAVIDNTVEKIWLKWCVYKSIDSEWTPYEELFMLLNWGDNTKIQHDVHKSIQSIGEQLKEKIKDGIEDGRDLEDICNAYKCTKKPPTIRYLKTSNGAVEIAPIYMSSNGMYTDKDKREYTEGEASPILEDGYKVYKCQKFKKKTTPVKQLYELCMTMNPLTGALELFVKDNRTNKEWEHLDAFDDVLKIYKLLNGSSGSEESKEPEESTTIIIKEHVKYFMAFILMKHLNKQNKKKVAKKNKKKVSEDENEDMFGSMNDNQKGKLQDDCEKYDKKAITKLWNKIKSSLSETFNKNLKDVDEALKKEEPLVGTDYTELRNYLLRRESLPNTEEAFKIYGTVPEYIFSREKPKSKSKWKDTETYPEYKSEYTEAVPLAPHTSIVNMLDRLECCNEPVPVHFMVFNSKDTGKPIDREMVKQCFESGIIDYIIMSDTGITGIDFKSTRQSMSMMVTPSRSPGLREQFVGRLVRDNSHKTIPKLCQRVDHVTFFTSCSKLFDNDKLKPLCKELKNATPATPATPVPPVTSVPPVKRKTPTRRSKRNKKSLKEYDGVGILLEEEYGEKRLNEEEEAGGSEELNEVLYNKVVSKGLNEEEEAGDSEEAGGSEEVGGLEEVDGGFDTENIRECTEWSINSGELNDDLKIAVVGHYVQMKSIKKRGEPYVCIVVSVDVDEITVYAIVENKFVSFTRDDFVSYCLNVEDPNSVKAEAAEAEADARREAQNNKKDKAYVHNEDEADREAAREAEDEKKMGDANKGALDDLLDSATSGNAEEEEEEEEISPVSKEIDFAPVYKRLRTNNGLSPHLNQIDNYAAISVVASYRNHVFSNVLQMLTSDMTDFKYSCHICHTERETNEGECPTCGWNYCDRYYKMEHEASKTSKKPGYSCVSSPIYPYRRESDKKRRKVCQRTNDSGYRADTWTQDENFIYNASTGLLRNEIKRDLLHIRLSVGSIEHLSNLNSSEDGKLIVKLNYSKGAFYHQLDIAPERPVGTDVTSQNWRVLYPHGVGVKVIGDESSEEGENSEEDESPEEDNSFEDLVESLEDLVENLDVEAESECGSLEECESLDKLLEELVIESEYN